MHEEDGDHMKKNKHRFLDIVMFCVLIGGTIAVLYPFFSDAITTIWDQQVINYYQKKANAENQAAIKEEQLRMEEENRRIEKNARPGKDPFVKKSKKVEKKAKGYYQMHTIAIIRIPEIRVTLPVFDKTKELFLQKGAALLEGTSYPTGGKNTHAVITGHRGLVKAKLFNDLAKLKKNNHFYIEVNGKTLAYQIDQIKTIEPTEVEALDIVKDQDHVTLMTCTPYGVNSHRLLVRGSRIPFTDEMEKKIQTTERQRMIFCIASILGSLLLLLFLIRLVRSRRKARGN